MTLNYLAKEAHRNATEKGFYEVQSDGSRKHRSGGTIAGTLMLIVTELAEACEADRKGDRENLQEELADVYIRMGDLCAFLEFDMEAAVEAKMAVNRNRPYQHGKRY